MEIVPNLQRDKMSVNLKGKPVETKKLVQEKDCFYDFCS